MRIKSILNNIAFIQFLVIMSVLYSQSQDEIVQAGIKNYQNGNYASAINYFNKAINNLSSSSNSLKYSEASKETKVTVKQEMYVHTKPIKHTVAKQEKHTVAKQEKHTVAKPEQYAEARAINYISAPMENIGEERANLYLYRGRTYMQLARYKDALNDFDKAVSINPSFSNAYFRRAIANHMLKADDICSDLLKASEMGHASAKMLYAEMCNE